MNNHATDESTNFVIWAIGLTGIALIVALVATVVLIVVAPDVARGIVPGG